MTTTISNLMSRPSFTVHHLFIVDTTSGSKKVFQNILSQVNDSIDSIRQSSKKHQEQRHHVTLMVIGSNKIKCNYHNVSIEDIADFHMPGTSFSAPGQLFDALGSCIATWRALSHRREEADRQQVSIFSSGKDQRSRKYTTCTLRMIISSLSQIGWRFTMIGSSPLLPQISSRLGITNYYISKSPQSARERNFLISQLKRQWRQQQIHPTMNNHSQAAA